MQINEALVCLVFAFNHRFQRPLKGVKSHRILISVTIGGTRWIWRLVYDQRANFLDIDSLMSSQKSVYSSHLKTHVSHKANQIKLFLHRSHRFLEKLVSFSGPATLYKARKIARNLNLLNASEVCDHICENICSSWVIGWIGILSNKVFFFRHALILLWLRWL